MAIGNKNAPKPNTWNSRSELYAPTGPIQLRTAPPSEDCRLTLNAASRGEYEISAAASKTATMMHKKPTSSLSRLFSVGVNKRTNLSSAFGEGRVSRRVLALSQSRLEEPSNGTMIPNGSFTTTNNFKVCVWNQRKQGDAGIPVCLSPRPQRPKHNRGSHDDAVYRKRREPPMPHPTHQPCHRSIGHNERHDEPDSQHHPAVGINLRNSDGIGGLSHQRLQQIVAGRRHHRRY